MLTRATDRTRSLERLSVITRHASRPSRTVFEDAKAFLANHKKRLFKKKRRLVSSRCVFESFSSYSFVAAAARLPSHPATPGHAAAPVCASSSAMRDIVPVSRNSSIFSPSPFPTPLTFAGPAFAASLPLVMA